MSLFLRLLQEDDKGAALAQVCRRERHGEADPRVFDVDASAFDAVPGKPFAYWVSDAVRKAFPGLPPLQNANRVAAIGASTKDDGRFLRLSWEVVAQNDGYPAFAKGGRYSPFYAGIHLVIRWRNDGIEPKAFVSDYRQAHGWSPHWKAELHNPDYYFRPGLTWPRRTNGLSFRVMPEGCIFADKGPAIFVGGDHSEELLALCAALNAAAFRLLVSLQLARTELAQSFEVGLIQQTPIPQLNRTERSRLAELGRRAWGLQRTLDTTTEISRAFLLPAALRACLGDFDPPAIEAELADIRAKIDNIAFELYGFSDADRAAALADSESPAGMDVDDASDDAEADDDEDSDDDASDALAPDEETGLLSWAVGVAFGRFDWRLATGEREPPPEPDPFDPLPAKSPGMLPDGAAPFHAHPGILVDDRGHPHDLARLVEEALSRVKAPVPTDVRKWLQRDFFPEHLKQYSKSRRKAPIYWPLATASGSYMLWVYYPSLTSQTLYTAVNDFVEPKLKQVGSDADALRKQGAARSRDEERRLEALESLELELTELRDALLKLAPGYQPNFDDGVQITAAPLWRLFQHRPWQKVLKETWEKLERGDYDWAHLALAYWPERVREKCKTDKSLAIAHGLEDLYVDPKVPAKPARRRKKKE